MKKFYLLVLSFFLLMSISTVGTFADEPNLITAVSDVAAKTGPAVVSIKTERVEHYQARYSYFGNPYDDALFDQFFQDFFGQTPGYEQKFQGIGSGVIIDAKGYVLTNDHVVHGADTITVTLPDGRKFPAQLTGVDVRSDLAVIKIDAGNTVLPVAPLGNSENLKIGQWVVAIGNPFGHILNDPQPTVTSGVISALHRTLPPQTSRRDSDYSDLIQTDAAINPGNSGGPLVNLAGEVIGINVAIFSTSGGYQGMGFAIPVNYAKMIVEQLVQGKKIDYGWIGVAIQDIDERLASYFDLGTDEGVLITKVIAASPAEKAGLKEGDIILSVNAIKIRNSSALIKQVSSATMDKPASFAVLRDKKSMTLSVMIGKRPSSEPNSIPAQAPPTKQAASRPWRGVSVQELSPDMARQLSLANSNGVLIAGIERGSPAQMSGLRTGDVIIAINKNPVANLADYSRLTQEVQGSCLIRTIRGFFVVEEK